MRPLHCLLVLVVSLSCGTPEEASPSGTAEGAFRTGDVLASRTVPVRVSKIVHADGFALHVLLYGEEFADVAAARDALERGSLSVMIGHSPMDRRTYTDESHLVLRNEPVSEQDLAGYRTYLDMTR